MICRKPSAHTNPLLADHEGVIALDARLRLNLQKGAGAANFAIVPYPDELVESIDWNGESIVVQPIRPEDEPQRRAFMEPGNARSRAQSRIRRRPGRV